MNKKVKGTLKKYLSPIIICVIVVGIAITSQISNAAGAVGEDPLVGFSFALEMEGQMSGYFTEVTGIGTCTEIVECRVVTDQGQEVVKKIPGKLSFNNVTLKRAITSNTDMWDWRKQVEDGRVDDAKVNCSIIMLDPTGAPVARWNLVNVWPSQITQKISDDGVYEEIIIVCEGVERVQ